MRIFFWESEFQVVQEITDFLPLLVSHLEVCCHCPGASHGVFVWIYPSTSAIALLDSWCCVWLPEPEGGREWREEMTAQ